MRKLLFALLLLIPSLIPSAAFARGFEITPTVGYRTSGTVTSTDDFGHRDNLDLKVDEKAQYGVTVDIPFSNNLQLELLANHQQTAFRFDKGLFAGSNLLGDVDIDYFHVGVLYTWGRGQVNPFVGAALGISRLQPKFSGLPSEDHFSGSIAGGVKLFFGRNVGLRLEARGYYSNIDSGIASSDHRSRGSNEGLYQGEGSAGLIFAF